MMSSDYERKSHSLFRQRIGRQGKWLFAALVIGSGAMMLPLQAAQGTRITAGTFVFENIGDINLQGQSGLRMQAAVDSAGGRFAPKSQCEFPECPPGTPISLSAFWSGQDLRGRASFRGRDFVLGSEGADGAFGTAQFEGTVTAPEFTGNQTVDVAAPFTFSGELAYPDASGIIQREPLSGGGVAILTLKWSPEGMSWLFSSARYEFTKH